jgi:hypothetical protein
MLGEVGLSWSNTRSLVPLIRELVEKDDPILLHQLLEESVGLTNGKHSVIPRERPRSAAARRSSGPQQAVSGF